MKRDDFTPIDRGIAIFLCDYTGKMAEPWVDAGFEVVLVDPQHPAGAHTVGLVTKIGAIITDCADMLGALLRTRRILLVAGFPPCTDVAVSGSRWFEAKRIKDPQFQAKAALVAEQCRMIGVLSGAPWFFENPVSVFSSIFGRAQKFFSPHDYTGYCADDNYTKKTCLWIGGGLRDAGAKARQIARRAGRSYPQVPARSGARELPQRYAGRLRAGRVRGECATRDCEDRMNALLVNDFRQLLVNPYFCDPKCIFLGLCRSFKCPVDGHRFRLRGSHSPAEEVPAPLTLEGSPRLLFGLNNDFMIFVFDCHLISNLKGAILP